MTSNEFHHESDYGSQSQFPSRREDTLWEQADLAVRENPIPAVLTAVAIGFGLGLLVRALESDHESHPIRDRVDETGDFLGSLFAPIQKRTRKAPAAVREALENAMEKVHEFAVDDCADPAARWWRRLWS